MALYLVIENPILNSPCEEPNRHIAFDDDGIRNDVIGERRRSSHFIPIKGARRRKGQQTFDTEWTADRIEPNENVNRIRERRDLYTTAMPQPAGFGLCDKEE